MMKKYLVVIKEVYESYREVYADSPEGAKHVALESAECEVALQYVRTLSEVEDIEVSEAQDDQ